MTSDSGAQARRPRERPGPAVERGLLLQRVGRTADRGRRARPHPGARRDAGFPQLHPRPRRWRRRQPCRASAAAGRPDGARRPRRPHERRARGHRELRRAARRRRRGDGRIRTGPPIAGAVVGLLDGSGRSRGPRHDRRRGARPPRRGATGAPTRPWPSALTAARGARPSSLPPPPPRPPPSPCSPTRRSGRSRSRRRSPAPDRRWRTSRWLSRPTAGRRSGGPGRRPMRAAPRWSSGCRRARSASRRRARPAVVVAVAPGAAAPATLAIEPFGVVTGVVTAGDGATLFPGAIVEALDEESDAVLATARADASGAFRLGALRPGTSGLRLRARSPYDAAWRRRVRPSSRSPRRARP